MTDNKYIRATEICIAVAKRGQRISPQQLATATGIERDRAYLHIGRFERLTQTEIYISDKDLRTIRGKDERNETGGEV